MSKPAFKHLRTKLLVSIVALVFLLTASVLVLVQAQMRAHITADLVSSLRADSALCVEVERARREQTAQSARMIANQPSVKALMSTNDAVTVEDGSAGILETTGADLLVLENASGQLLGFHAKSSEVKSAAVEALMQASAGAQDWWFANGKLFDVSLQEIVAGPRGQQRPLGRLVLGREVSGIAVGNTATFGNSRTVFERAGKVLVSSLPPQLQSEFEKAKIPGRADIREVTLGGERYLTSSVALPGDHAIRLHSLQSFDQATAFLRSLNRMLLLLGTLALLVGAVLAFFLSTQITRPIERLADGARQLEKGNFDFQISAHGLDEVAHLTRAFEEMRNSLQQSREALLRSARLEAVGRLAGGVAHDFNNLVMIIKGYSSLLLDRSPAEMRPQLEEINRAGDRASALTRQLLAFSRKQVLEPQVLDPNQILGNMAKMLRVLLGENIELITNLSEPVGCVQVDPGQLEQVLMNLAVNARDAMPNGGKLVVETRAEVLDKQYAKNHLEVHPGSFVLIAVTDSGCGMDKETLTHIFEPFFTTKEPGKGTGLGLATVYGIVKQSHGHITVYSELGIGTTFKVYLPSVGQQALPTVTSKENVALACGEGTVLLVEDEPALRALTAEGLKRVGYTVLEASDGLEALKVARDYRGVISVVLSDVVMPRMGGPQFVEKLKESRRDFAVIFMSGYTETTALENEILGTEAVFLSKPFTAETLSRKILEIKAPLCPCDARASCASD